jgi:hypothetical protein
MRVHGQSTPAMNASGVADPIGEGLAHRVLSPPIGESDQHRLVAALAEALALPA